MWRFARFLSQIDEVHRNSEQQRRQCTTRSNFCIRTVVLLQTQRSLGIDFAISTRFAHHCVLRSYLGTLYALGLESIFILLLHYHSNKRLCFACRLFLLVSASLPFSQLLIQRLLTQLFQCRWRFYLFAHRVSRFTLFVLWKKVLQRKRLWSFFLHSCHRRMVPTIAPVVLLSIWLHHVGQFVQHFSHSYVDCSWYITIVTTPCF